MEYEMKFSEYGEKLENSDVYSESQKRAIQSMLTEAKATMKKLTAAQAKKLKKKGAKVDEAAKPDFLDMDKDGNKKEPMKKAIKDKKVKEGFPTVDDAKKRHEKEKGTGKFDKKETGDGRTQYTRKSNTFTDGGDDGDVKAAKKKEKKVKEDDDGRLSFTRTPDGKTSVSSSTGRIRATIDKDGTSYSPGKSQGQRSTQPLPPGTTPEEAKKDPRYKTDPEFKKEVDAAMQIGVNEASKRAKKDYDKDGKIESGKDEYLGSKIRAAKKAGKMEEAAKCNHTSKGKSCPVHGLKECGGMNEEGETGVERDASARRENDRYNNASNYQGRNAKGDVIRSGGEVVKGNPNPPSLIQRAAGKLGLPNTATDALGNPMYKSSTPKSGSGRSGGGGVRGGVSGHLADPSAVKSLIPNFESKNSIREKATGSGEKGKKIAATAKWKNAAR
jgi:hypothetical protein